MNRRTVVIDPAVLAWALGFGVFLGVAGASAVAPPDSLTQLVLAAMLWMIVTPVIYLVLDADDVGRNDVSSRMHFPYFVVVTLTSVVTAALVPVAATGVAGILARVFVFLCLFGVVSGVAIWHGQTGTDHHSLPLE